MKSGEKRLFITLLLTIIATLLLNNFVSSILSGYVTVGFLVLLTIIYVLILGFEKDRSRYWRSICLEVIIFLLAYFLVYYLSGLFFSFYKPMNYYTIQGIVKTIIPLVISIIIKEILRYVIVVRSCDTKPLLITSCIMFILLDLLGLYTLKTFITPNSTFMFLAKAFLPIASKNIACTYITYKSGYRPTVLYRLVIESYIYFLPIVPNPNEYIYALFQLIVPFILLYRVYVFYKKERDEDIVLKQYRWRILKLIPSAIIIIVLAYFTSGYFHYHAIVVGSGSMVPSIYKGDVVVIERVHENFDKIDIGEVMAVQHDGIMVVHRLVKKINVKGEWFFFTKGDANNDIDNYKITTDMIYGVVKKRIPKIGYPTVWLKNL